MPIGQSDNSGSEKVGAEAYLAARSRVFHLDPADTGIEASPNTPRVWGVVMDVSQPGVTLVALADGTASLYFSNGGGIIGAGEHKPVAKARDALITLAQEFDSQLEPTTNFPLPPPGSVRFYLLTFAGVRTGEVVGAQHELLPLSEKCNDVISAIRKCTDARVATSKDNRVLLTITAACLAVGAIVGATAAEERLPGALMGGILGLIVGFIGSGVVQIVSRAVRSRSS